jgi:hypothetical protein
MARQNYKNQQCPHCDRIIANNVAKRHIDSCNGVYFEGPLNPSKNIKKDPLETKHKKNEALKKAREVRRKIPMWNKGLTAKTDDRLKQIGIKCSQKLKGRPGPKHTQATKDKCRKKALADNRQRKNRKTILYNGIYLDSSWELKVAIDLDKNNIKWTRPEPVYYQDGSSRRRYFADFYLPAYDVYLDPKNERVRTQSIKKFELIAKDNPDMRLILLNYNQLSWEIIQELIRQLK